MTNLEQLLASLIDEDRITGAEAVVLFKAIYTKERSLDFTVRDNKSTSISSPASNNWLKHQDVLCSSIKYDNNDSCITTLLNSTNM